MGTSSLRKPGSIAIQLAVLIVFVGASLALLARLGAFKPRSEFPHRITFQVKGSAGQAFVTFTTADGRQTERQDVILPWQTHVTFTERTTVILTAGNPAQYGTIECALILDGEVWKQESIKAPETKVACGGVVR